MEKILLLCDLVSCSMDTLLRGSAEEEAAYGTAGYDLHCNHFTYSIAGATATMLAGVIVLLLLTGFLWNLWHIGWVTYPAGGILCAIVSILLKKDAS